MQAQFCSPVSTLIRTPLASFAIITHSFNDRNLILRKTDGEYAKRGREAEGCTLIFRFCVKPMANTQNGGEKPRGAALILRFCVKPRVNTQNGGGQLGVVFVAKRLRVWYHFNVLICFNGCGFDHMIADACKSKL